VALAVLASGLHQALDLALAQVLARSQLGVFLSARRFNSAVGATNLSLVFIAEFLVFAF